MSSAALAYLQKAFQVGRRVSSRTVGPTGVEQQEEHARPVVLLLLFDGCGVAEETTTPPGQAVALLASGYWLLASEKEPVRAPGCQ